MKKQIKTLFIAMSLFAVPLGVSLPTFSCKTKLSLEQFEEYKKNIIYQKNYIKYLDELTNNKIKYLSLEEIEK